jgi:hypothetical protein
VGPLVSGDLVVITSCTGSKLDSPGGMLRTAESLYCGQQHVRLMCGVTTYRAAGQPAGPLRLRILSAHYGLLAPNRRIATYDRTFAGMPPAAIRREAHRRGVPNAVRQVLTRPFAGGVLLLADPYLCACDFDEHIRLGGPLISFCSPAVARRLPPISGLRKVPLANAEARRFSCGLIALKGELASRLLVRLAAQPEDLRQLLSERTDVLNWLETETPKPRSAAV